MGCNVLSRGKEAKGVKNNQSKAKHNYTVIFSYTLLHLLHLVPGQPASDLTCRPPK